jgi:Zn-dependent metalloprotease
VEKLIVRLVVIFLCFWIQQEFRFPLRVFAGYEMQSTDTNPQADFMNLNMPLPPDAIIRRDANSGTIFFLRARNLSAGLEENKDFQELQTKNLPAQIALAFLTAHRSAFQLIWPSDEMTVSSVDTDNLGLTHVRLQQMFKGIRVWTCEIIIHLDRSNHVYLMQGRYIPTPVDVATRPLLCEEDAFQIVAGKLPKAGPDCRQCRSELIIFAQSKGQPRLAYRILATPGPTEGWAYVIDAETGDILEKIPTVYSNGGFPMQMKNKRTD